MQNLIDSVIKELEQRNYFEAIKYCNQLIVQFPKNHVFYEIRGNCYLETGSFVTAIQNYADALEFLPPTDSKSKVNIASLYNRRGYARLKLNLFNEAISDFQKAIDFKHDFAEAYNNCGNAYRKLEKYDEALTQCNRAIEYKEDFAEAYNNRGNIYYLFSKDNEAIRDYSKAIELNPNYAGAYYNRGIAYYYLQNKLSEARSDWQKVIKLNPSYEKELNEKIEKINNALEHIEGKDVSESMSLVKEEEQAVPEIKEPEQETREHTEEPSQEQVLEIYTEQEHKEPEEIKPEEPIVEEKPEEPIVEEKPEEPIVEEKPEEPIVEENPEEPVVEEKPEEPVIEEKTEETIIEEKKEEKSEDIEIPEIDFKSMFRDDDKEAEIEEDIKPLTEIFELIYQSKAGSENIIPDEVKQLHKEIESTPVQEEKPKEEEELPKQKEFIHARKPREIILPEEPHHKAKLPEADRLINPIYINDDEEKKSLFKSPIFVVPVILLVLLVLSVASYLMYNKYISKRNQNTKQEKTAEKTDTVKSAANIDSTQIKDTTSEATTEKDIKEDTQKKEGKKEEEKVEKNTTPEVTMIKNFVVVKEKDGIYLQVASLKEKGSADTKAASINKKGVTAKVIEADLGAKGKYYRVRIGPFKTIDEAKTAANKVD
jgi:tetratricopeptide (TPR) repeat protein